jgi:hypothetical protein
MADASRHVALLSTCGAPRHHPRQLEERKTTPMPPSTSSLLPVSFLLSPGREPRCHRRCCSVDLTRAHHNTATHSTTPTTLPPPHEPRRPPHWSSQAQGKRHCRLLPARISLECHCSHGPPWPTPHNVSPSHLIPVLSSPSRLDAIVRMSPSELVRSRRNTATHHHDMPTTGARTWPHSSTPSNP